MRTVYKEIIVRWAKRVTPCLNLAMAIYTALITWISFAYSSIPVGSKTSLNTWQSQADFVMTHINWVGGIGVVLVVWFVIIRAVLWWFCRSLYTPADTCPCIGTLVKSAFDAMVEGEYLGPKDLIAVYKASAGTAMKIFASSSDIQDHARTFSISKDNEEANQGKPGKCWYMNRSMLKQRVYDFSEEEINLPVIVSRNDRMPWGIIRVITPFAKDPKRSKAIQEYLTKSDGLLPALESLLERQRKFQHFVNFAEETS